MFSKLEARLVNKESNVACLVVDILFINSQLPSFGFQVSGNACWFWEWWKRVQIVCFGTFVLWDSLVVIFSCRWKGLPQGKILKFTDKSSTTSMSIWALIHDRINYFLKHVPQIITNLSEEIHELFSVLFKIVIWWCWSGLLKWRKRGCSLWWVGHSLTRSPSVSGCGAARGLSAHPQGPVRAASPKAD